MSPIVVFPSPKNQYVLATPSAVVACEVASRLLFLWQTASEGFTEKAATGSPYTLMGFWKESRQEPFDVTTSNVLYVPKLAKECEGEACVDLLPSPRCQL